ncbi:hypothetical protein BCR41DRAFT_350193 [Lobosporangium transversale]|uniref:Protein MMS22-like N-terminal domain-containing protein n=1 Tax=Lobosporangium transversale TaxID=64571 RepID=A0A1Y2GSX6_9FUNG|nr:hypothetical protein BCR41DRAFT_350193 [Lobosporangium transversale]ORZ21894.1 hypothetical protein BCR41DRAFT_350193 [Lobosporangium transversale]|eukprot:XP_021883145.1 hypothetical protein BCR41DRAFT_350193 [Lobosporangium transversale]
MKNRGASKKRPTAVAKVPFIATNTHDSNKEHTRGSEEVKQHDNLKNLEVIDHLEKETVSSSRHVATAYLVRAAALMTMSEANPIPFATIARKSRVGLGEESLLTLSCVSPDTNDILYSCKASQSGQASVIDSPFVVSASESEEEDEDNADQKNKSKAVVNYNGVMDVVDKVTTESTREIHDGFNVTNGGSNDFSMSSPIATSMDIALVDDTASASVTNGTLPMAGINDPNDNDTMSGGPQSLFRNSESFEPVGSLITALSSELDTHNTMYDCLVSDTPASPPTQQIHHSQPIFRSYPLRERTIQQRQPYTVDKQQHAYFYKKRTNNIEQPSLTRITSNEGILSQNHQDDEEDSDYEENRTERNALKEPELIIPSRRRFIRTLRGKNESALDSLIQDLDNDGLPSIDELRHQFMALQSAGSFSPTAEDLEQFSSDDVSSPSNMKRRLKRLVHQRLESLDNLDEGPKSNSNTRASNVTKAYSSSNRIGSSSRQLSLSPPPMAHSEDLADIDTNANKVGSPRPENEHDIRPTKRSKKSWQHVLPRSFFKQHNLPQDPIELKTMRSKWSRTKPPGRRTTSKPDHLLPPHVAKRRIPSMKQGDDGLKDFFARLGQEQEESEDEADHTAVVSQHASPEDREDVLEHNLFRDEDWSSHPTLDDTVATRGGLSWTRRNTQNYRASLSQQTISSDEEDFSLNDNERKRRVLDSTLPSYFPSVKAMHQASHRKTEDLIDRMIVRQRHATSTSRRPSSATISRKRRRMGGDHSFRDIHRINSSRPYSRPHKRSTHSLRAEVNGEASDSQSEAWTEFRDQDFDTAPRKRAGGDLFGNYDLTYRHMQVSESDDTDDDIVGGQLRLTQMFKSQRGTHSPHYALPRYDSFRTASPKPVGPLLGIQIVTNNNSMVKPRHINNSRSAFIQRRTRVNRSKQPQKQGKQKNATPHTSRGMLYSVVEDLQRPVKTKESRPKVSYLPWTARFQPGGPAQYIDKPVFQSISRTIPTMQRAQVPVQQPNFGRLEKRRQKTPEKVGNCCEPEQSRSYEESASTPILNFQPQSTECPTAIPRSRAAFKRNKNDIASEGTIANGLYFSRDTYIGRGSLTRLLSSISAHANDKEAMAQPTILDLAFFGRPFIPNWKDMTSVEHDLGVVVLDWKRRFQLIQEWSIARETHLRNGSDVSTEFISVLDALATFGNLLIERFSAMERTEHTSFWRVFKSAVVGPLARLIESERIERKRSLDAILVLWTRWSLMAWAVIADCVLLTEYSHADSAIRALMGQLLDVSDAGFLARLSTSLDPQYGGLIGGEDVIEIWICSIHLLNRYSEVRTGSSDFWRSLNRQLQHRWEGINQSLDVTGDRSQYLEWQIQANHFMDLLQQLCRLHQFEANGSSNASIKVKDNWGLVRWMLDQDWLGRVPSESADAEYHVRRFLVFCHSRIHIWDWFPSVDVVVGVYRHFSKQGFRDMPTEPGYRLPEFLKRMITRLPRRHTHAGEQITNDKLTGLNVNMSLVTSVEEHDRCFEVYLKVLAMTIWWQLYHIDLDQGEPDGTQRAQKTIVDQWDRSTDSLSYQGAIYEALDRANKIKVCKRMLAAISVPVSLTMPSSEGYTYSSVCNLCNLALIIDLLVPDVLRPSSVGQIRSILQFEESDNASRTISLESVYYLGTIWQRQREHKFEGRESGRQLTKILENIFSRLAFLCDIFENEWVAISDGSATSTSLANQQQQQTGMIGIVVSQLSRLLHQERFFFPRRLSFPNIAFLDQRLSRIFNPEVPYPPKLREQVLDVIVRFLTLRRMYMIQHQGSIVRKGQGTTNVVEDEFSWLDDERLVFDENDLEDFVAPPGNSPLDSIPKATLTSINTATNPSCTPMDLPENNDFGHVLWSWVYPSLLELVKIHQQTLINAADPHQPIQNPTSLAVEYLSKQGTWIALGILADCGVILLKQHHLKMHDITGIFGQKPSYTPWMQFKVLQNQLVWATRVAESWPEVLMEHEDLFLRLWFATIGLPAHELTLQHRFTKAIADIVRVGSQSLSGQNSGLCKELFKNLPSAPLDLGHLHGNKSATDQWSKSVKEKAWWHQKLMRDRPKLIERVLSNMGEHCRSVRDDISPYRAAAVKGRCQGYLNMLLIRIKADAERLESKRLALETMQLADFSHLVIGYIMQHCGVIIKDSGLLRTDDSILNFLTSSQHFPQPPVDCIQIVTRIRGYAMLYNDGEDHFFQDVLEMILSQLKLVHGKNSMRFDWPEREPSAGGALVANVVTMRISDRGNSCDVTLTPNGSEVQFLSAFPMGSELGIQNENATALPINNKAPLRRRNTGMTSLRHLVGQPWRVIIQALLSSRAEDQLSPYEETQEALWALTASLDNSGVFGENWRQWNAITSSFRVMVFVSITRPLLTAFLGSEGYRSIRPAFLQGEGGIISTALRLPRRLDLIIIAAAACRWTISVIEGLAGSVDAMIHQLRKEPQAQMSAELAGQRYCMNTALMAIQSFQYETAMLFPSLLQCLVGCLDLINIEWLQIVRERLGDLRPVIEAQNPFMENSKDTLRAIHLFGQVLQIIRTILPVLIKVQAQYPDFYVIDKRNGAWQNAVLVLAQCALDRGLFLMQYLGGATPDERSSDESIYLNEGHGSSLWFENFMTKRMSDYTIKADQISGTWNLSSAEARLPDFLEQLTKLAPLERRVHVELHKISSLECWRSDVLSWNSEAAKAHDEPSSNINQQSHQQQQKLHSILRDTKNTASREQKWCLLKKQDWVLWSFLSSFLDFCRSASAISPRFQRQVQRGFHLLLKDPDAVNPSIVLGSVPQNHSVWRHLLDHSVDPFSDGKTQTSSWNILQWCMAKEWRLALMEYPEQSNFVFASDPEPAPWLF